MIFYILMAVCGACAGSFTDFLSFCVINGENVFRSRSRCPACHHILRFPDLVPVFSFLVQRGRCRYCGAEIPLHHLLNEVFSSMLFLLIAFCDGMSVTLLRDLLLLMILQSLSLIDLYTMEIPDIFHFILVILYISFSADTAGILNALWEGTLSASLFYIAGSLSSRLLRKETMGGGDVRLFFSVGMYLGFSGTIICVFLSSLAGMLICILSGKKQIPFGPCISFGFINVILFGSQLETFFFRLPG